MQMSAATTLAWTTSFSVLAYGITIPLRIFIPASGPFEVLRCDCPHGDCGQLCDISHSCLTNM